MRDYHAKNDKHPNFAPCWKNSMQFTHFKKEAT